MPFAFLSRVRVPDLSGCRLRQSPSVLATVQGEEAVLFDTKRERYYTLNEVGAASWALLRESMTLEQLVEIISREFAAPKEVVAADLLRLASQLQEAGLVVTEPDPGSAP
jgi:putative NIF3 family GTP cyclohydrolase 1 type 2